MSPHLYLAHLPFTLLLVGAIADLAGALTGRESYRRGGGYLLIAGALAALLAFFTGQSAVPYAFARPQPPYALIEAHSQWGGAGVWVIAAAGGLRAAWRRRLSGPYGWANLGIALVSLVLVFAITRSGLAIVHGG